MRLFGSWFASALTRVLLWMYPSSFRREMGRQIVEDVRRRAAEFEGALAPVRMAVWMVRLSVSLVINAFGAWREDRLSPTARYAAGTSGAFSWLDVKLGLRMLVKYPGLTLASSLATLVTIAIGVGSLSFIQDFSLRPTLPLEEGERIVSLGMDATNTWRTPRRLLHDFVVWRSELETIDNVAIWRRVARNIVTPDGRGELAPIAIMSASGFTVARVPPLLGRPLVAADEIDGAPPVVVLGYKEWTTRFGGDSDIVGQTVQIGREVHTIVGVMPEGFTFPLSERLWIPFRDDPDDYPVMEGPDGSFVFGRLAPGVTQEVAQAEITYIASRRAAEFPDAYEHLRSRVMGYTDSHTGSGDSAGEAIFLRMVIGLATLVLFVPFVNVAILVYARTATRAGEIAVRTALGASRRRVVTQLFVEALVMAALPAGAGVAFALFAVGRMYAYVDTFSGNGMPFWAKAGHDPWVIAYAAGLTIVAAVVAGVVPGLKATGKGVHLSLSRTASGNGMRLGGTWTALIVTQVAITVALLPLAGSVGWHALGLGLSRPTFATDQLLGARISTEKGPSWMEFSDRTEASSPEAIEEVIRRLEVDPRVAGVTLTSSPIEDQHFGGGDDIEVEGIDPPLESEGHAVGVSYVGQEFFTVLGVPIESGRSFDRADWDVETPPVIVNSTFVRQVLEGANPIGRHIRTYRRPEEEAARWREIIGVVEDLTSNPIDRESVVSQLFVPLDRSRIAEGVQLIVRVRSSLDSFVPELRRITTAVDPTLRLELITSLDDLDGPLQTMTRAAAAGLLVVMLSILLISCAGIFSLMSFNVTQRRREIGIRSALGANPRRVLVSVMVRSVKQLGIGVLVGLSVAAAIPEINIADVLIQRDMRLVMGVAVLMVTVGMLAAAGPARRGLRIQPTEALREE